MNWGPLVWFDENSSGAAGGAAASGGVALPSGGGTSASATSTPPSGEASPPEGAGVASSDSYADSSRDSGGDPFDGMDTDDFDSVEIAADAAGTGDEPGPDASAAGAGAEGEPKPVATVPTPQSAPQQTPAAPTAPAPPTENVPSSGRSQLETALEGLRSGQTQLSDWAAQNLFKLSEEDVAALDTNAADAIPRFMGRVYTQAMQSALNLIKNVVPELVNSGITTQQERAGRAAAALNEFYQANPHLSADQHGAAVDKWARAFRSANPQASRSDAIAFVGKAVSAEFGIWPSQNGSGAVAKRPPPFAPARPGGRAPATQKGPHDPYAGMEDDLD